MFYKQTHVKITGYGLAAGCQVFYRKIYGFFYSVLKPQPSLTCLSPSCKFAMNMKTASQLLILCILRSFVAIFTYISMISEGRFSSPHFLRTWTVVQTRTSFTYKLAIEMR